MSNREEVTTAFTRQYPAGTLLFEENDPGSRMYVIRKGRVRIYRRVEESEMVLAILGPGDFFGEMAILEDLPRSANAQTMEEVELIEVDAATFEQMILHNAEVAVRMLRKLASRVRELDVRLQNILVDSGVGRAVEVLRWLVPKGKDEGQYVRLDGSVVHIAIAAQAGMSPAEVQRVYERLRGAGCIREDGRDVLIARTETLDAYSSYLDLKRRYEPASPGQETGAASEQSKQLAIQRLLKALQVDVRELETHKAALSGQYREYLKLRQQFESGRSPAG